MAIFGAGSKWNLEELKDDFFDKEYYQLGWGKENSQDLYYLLSTIKIGDIIYLKSNRAGSTNINIKGIGIVCDKTEDNSKLSMKWIITDPFKISIEHDTGKLTNIRASTIYEEYNPEV